MPYLGRAPVGAAGNIIEGDLKVTGQLTANETLFKQILDGTDGSSSNAGDNFLIEDGGTDGSGTNAGDDICLEQEQNLVPNFRSWIRAPGLRDNPASSLSSLISDRGWTEGFADEGVYWFNNGTDTFPSVIRNESGYTWLLLQKNFVPHAYKGGDGNSGSDLSYGLMNSYGNAIVTTAINNNTTPTAATLGINHARMSVTGWPTSSFSVLGAYDSADTFRTYSAATAADLHALIVLGQANNNTFVANTVYTMTGGSTMYLVFNTNFDDGDGDAGKMGMTDDNANTQDVHNTAAEWNGVSWYQDGGTAYTSNNANSALQGATQGDFSFWVR